MKNGERGGRRNENKRDRAVVIFVARLPKLIYKLIVRHVIANLSI